MVILTKDNKIFIHIPKNAGKFVRKRFTDKKNIKKSLWGIKNKIDRPHIHFPMIYDYFSNFDQLDSYCIVRNPYHKFVIGYNYSKRSKYLKSVILTKNMSHLEFLKSFDETKILYDHSDVHMAPQHVFVYYKGIKQIKNIWKYETLGEKYSDFKEVIPDISNLSKEVIQLINEKYSLDFELFGYEKINCK